MSKPKSQLDRAIHFAIDQAERVGDPLLLPLPLKIVYLVQGAQGVIDNGGLHFFFGHDWHGQPPYAVFVDAYRAIGAVSEADALASAVASFPFADPHKHECQRREFIEQFLIDKDRTRHRPDSPFEIYDICGSEAVWRQLSAYVAAHAESFPP